MSLSILADENIPLVAKAFGELGTVRLLPGAAIDAAATREADVLLVRSVTRVDAALVEGSRLRFVGSATIGTDHVDRAALDAAGITFRHAPGSNAESVVEWVLAVLLLLAVRCGGELRGRTLGVVGCGNTGRRLAARGRALGMRVLCNDPPLAELGGHEFVSLARVLEESHILSLHVPLTRVPPHPTFHLVDAAALARTRPGVWLLNSSRGGVVRGEGLLEALRCGQVGAAALDVWEGEPAPDPALMTAVDVATPHVAGYSWDGKVAGTRMLYDALAEVLGVAPAWQAEDGTGTELPLAAPTGAGGEAAWLHQLVRQMYDVAADHARLAALAALPAAERATGFRALRRDYPRRRTFRRHTVAGAAVPAALREAVTGGLGVTLR